MAAGRINLEMRLKILFCALLCTLFFGSCEKIELQSKENTPTKEVNDGDDDSAGKNDTSSSSGGNTESGTDNTADKYNTGDELNVETYLNSGTTALVWVKGYIVGTCYRSHDRTTLEPPFGNAGSTSILIADDPNEKDLEKMMIVKLRNGNMRNALNLQDHPENLHKALRVMGYRCVYLKFSGMKDIVDYEFPI